MKNNFWAHKTAEIQEGAKIGVGTKIWQNSQVLSGAEVGDNCVIGHNCFVGSKAKLGKRVKLESNIDVWDLVELEDYVFVGPSVAFTNDLTPRAMYPKINYPKFGKWLPTLVKEGASIGANATVICNITIGSWAMVGAGAVVRNDVKDYEIVVGNPAKVIGWICKCGNKIRIKKNLAVCRICKRKYQKRGNNLYNVK